MPACNFSQSQARCRIPRHDLSASDTAVHSAPALLSRKPRVYRFEVKIEQGRRVTLKVDLAVKDGQQLEKSTVEYIHGGGMMLPGIERVLEGLQPGAKRDGVLAPSEAFGAQQPIKKLKRREFPQDAKLVVGEKFSGKADNGMNVVLLVERVTGDEIEVRYVHPLADKQITYAVEVVQVRDPRPPPVPAQALELEEEA
jgi:FKBP-type peptidyl-prolyl cis-trans isomerase SlyD